MNNQIITLQDVLNIQCYYKNDNVVTFTGHNNEDYFEAKDQLMLFTQSSKYLFLLPITNYGGFSHELYSLVSRYPDIAKKLKGYFESLEDISKQWMLEAVKKSISISRYPDDFSIQFEMVCNVLESLIIKEINPPSPPRHPM